MTDLQRIALIVGGCAAAAGAIGLVALRLLRGRSLRAKLIMAVTPTILSTVAGVVATAGAGLVSGHDRAPVIEVSIAAGLVLPELAILLAHRVVAEVGILRAAIHAIGEGTPTEHDDKATLRPCHSRRERSYKPVGLASAELNDLSRELIAAQARLSRSRERERAEDRSLREVVAKAALDLRAPLADLRALTVALENTAAADPVACYARVLMSVDQLTGLVDRLFELCHERGDHRDPTCPGQAPE